MIANKEGGAPHGTAAHSFARSTMPREAMLADGYEAALDRTWGWLRDRQQADGHWVGELEGDTILESETILLMAFFGREREGFCLRSARYLLEHQLPEGGWPNYPGGPADLSTSVKGYFALKLTGTPVDHPEMVKARQAVLRMGGAGACNSFTRFYLALLGQISYDECPTVPPELTLIPKHWGFSLYAMSSWTRTIVVPLSIVSHFKPVRKPPVGIDELFVDGVKRWTRPKHPLFSWSRFFLVADRGLKWFDRLAPAALRRRGVKAAHRWMVEHFEDSDGVGAIYPPMVYTILALHCLGYEPDSQAVAWAWRQLEDLRIDEGETTRFQPCVSPVWDTAIAAIALSDADERADDGSVEKAADWLLSKEIRRGGDWQVRRPGIEPTGWHFQYANGFYPDIDDTAMVLMALLRAGKADEPRYAAAIKRAVDWLLAMQNKDGGWAAFDVDIDNEVLTKVPFADHNAMLDPSCADITARVIEALGDLNYPVDHPAVRKGLDYLWRTQEPEGCWYGRWGVNYVYGTWQVLQGLKAIGHPMDHPALVRAADWLEATQQACGGWGETCRTYDDPSLKGTGNPTPSQTAWAVLGLIAAGRATSPAVARGIQHLVDTQSEDGSWDEDDFTGTGFPRVFYLRYHLYRVSFPLMAIARYGQAVARGRSLAPGALASRIPADPRPTV